MFTHGLERFASQNVHKKTDYFVISSIVNVFQGTVFNVVLFIIVGAMLLLYPKDIT